MQQDNLQQREMKGRPEWHKRSATYGLIQINGKANDFTLDCVFPDSRSTLGVQ